MNIIPSAYIHIQQIVFRTVLMNYDRLFDFLRLFFVLDFRGFTCVPLCVVPAAFVALILCVSLLTPFISNLNICTITTATRITINSSIIIHIPFHPFLRVFPDVFGGMPKALFRVFPSISTTASAYIDDM